MILDELIDSTYRSKFIEQGSDEWDQIRVGRFTSSEIWKIMECGKRPMTDAELKSRPKTGKGSSAKFIADPSQMSAAGITYINQKVAEVLTGRPKQQSYAYPLVYGKDMEPVAVEHFEKMTGWETYEVGFEPFSDHAGGSPDRLIGDEDGLEIKCPYESINQVDYLMLTDHYDLKRNHPDKYWQCVSLMMFTGRKRWHFCTFDPRMILEKHKMTHIIIEAEKVQDDFELINQALGGAIKLKLELLNTLK